jgi:hypothetical protein
MPTLKAEPGRYLITGYPAAFLVYRRFPRNSQINTLIGRVLSDWSLLEHTLDRIIWELADDPTGACLTANLTGSSPRLSKIEALRKCGKLTDDILDPVAGLRESLCGVQELRNRILHDPWYFEESTQEIRQYKTRRGQGFHKVNVTHLKETLVKIDQRLKAVGKLRNAILAAIS